MTKMMCVASLLVAFLFVGSLAIGTVDAEGLTQSTCTTPCTPAQCKLQDCDASVPYACVAGSAEGGCAFHSSTFNTSQCTECCNVMSCAITCGECSAETCASTPCSTQAPYLCTNGSDAGGCAYQNSSWSLNPGCSACCDATTCPTTPAPPSPSSSPSPGFSKCSAACSLKDCHSKHRCEFQYPFMCTAGSSKDGCSANASTWDTPLCTACCDVALCPTIKCGHCSHTTCGSTQCSATNPYICTGGKLKGGCSPDKKYFEESPDCSSCCSFNTCPVRTCEDRCSDAVCQSESCSASDPYLCTSGPDAGGCASTGSSWGSNPAGCSSCCDTTLCNTTQPPTTVPTNVPGWNDCDGNCSAKTCRDPARCSKRHSYMCTSGQSKGGCASTPNPWDSQLCSSCCDITTCPQIHCGKCSQDVCLSTACSAQYPYICTAGQLDGGCSADPNYFTDTPGCTACCDYNSCKNTLEGK